MSKKPKSSLLSTLGQYNDPPETLKDRPFYDMVLDPEQEAFRDAIWDRNKLAVICNSKAGTGKAQPISTIIPTPNGYRKLGDIKVGDYVFDRTGSPTKVLGVFPQGKQRVFKLTIGDGRSTLCGPEHLWTYVDYWNKGNDRRTIWKNKTTLELFNSPLKTHGRVSRYSIPNNLPVQYPTKFFMIDPYVIGVFLGDGCCLENNLSISTPEYEIIEEIANLTDTIPTKNSMYNHTWTFRNKEGSNIRTKNFFKGYEEYLIRYSREKRIPPEYLTGNILQRLYLLQGLLDTDGAISVSGGRYNITYCTTSYNLAIDILQLTFSLGISAHLSLENEKRSAKYKSGHCYNISFMVDNDVKPYLFRKSRHKYNIAVEATQIVKSRKYEYNQIIGIDDLGYEDEMVCIYVDNPEHLYLTNDFIVTHNTTIALGVALLLYQYQRYDGIVYIISPTMEQKQGFIPGGPEDKNAPYQQPLCEALITLGVDPKQAIMSDDNLQAMKEGRSFIQFISDTYLRGTNFENKIVIIDEAQNFYFNDLQKDLTRIHDSCKTIIIGHDKQCDIIKHPERSGFIPYLRAFSSLPAKEAEKIAICELKTNHRGWFSTFCDNVDIEGNILLHD